MVAWTEIITLKLALNLVFWHRDFFKTLLTHDPLHTSSYKMSLTLNVAPENNPDILNSGGKPIFTEDHSDMSDLVKCQFINTVCYYQLHRPLRTRSRATGCIQLIQNILALSSYLLIDRQTDRQTNKQTNKQTNYEPFEAQWVAHVPPGLTTRSALFSNHTV